MCFKKTSQAALFTITRTWKQPECTSTEEQILKKDVLYIYNEILLSHKKEGNNAISETWMNVQIVIQ